MIQLATLERSVCDLCIQVSEVYSVSWSNVEGFIDEPERKALMNLETL